MKLRKKASRELSGVYRTSYGSNIEFCFNPFDIFLDCVEINLPDMGVYQVVSLGCYNIKATRKIEYVIKLRGNVRIKPEFIDQVLEGLREQEQN